MQAVACPQCGAPIQGPISGPFYQCPYCRQTSKSQAPEPARPPQFVIIQQPSYAPPAPFSSPAAMPSRPSRSMLLPTLMPLLIIGLVMGLTFRTQITNLTGIGAWDGSTPLICDGNDDISVTGVNVNYTQGAAVLVRGNCHVRLNNCAIKAPVAIDASGNGQVTVVNGSVNGEVDASGNANVSLLGNVKSSGATKRSNNARVTGR